MKKMIVAAVLTLIGLTAFNKTYAQYCRDARRYNTCDERRYERCERRYEHPHYFGYRYERRRPVYGYNYDRGRYGYNRHEDRGYHNQYNNGYGNNNNNNGYNNGGGWRR